MKALCALGIFLALLLAASIASASPFVQGAASVNTGTLVSISTPSITVTAGDRLIVFYGVTTAQTATISDGQSDTFVQRAMLTNGNAGGYDIYAFDVTSAIGGATVITVNGGIHVLSYVKVLEYNGVTGAFIGSNGTITNSATQPISSGNIDVTPVPAILIVEGADWSDDATAPVVGAGFTTRTTYNAAAPYNVVQAGDQSISVAGNAAGTITFGSQFDNISLLAIAIAAPVVAVPHPVLSNGHPLISNGHPVISQ